MSLDDRIKKFLDDWSNRDLTREIRWISPEAHLSRNDGGTDFSSNDYLGLANSPEVAEAIADGLKTFGNGSTSSRLISGSISVFRDLEQSLAEWNKKEAALYFNSGYQTNVSLFSAISGPKDHILFDRLTHASLIDGIRLSGTKSRSFKHNDIADLEKKLERIQEARSDDSHTFVVTEGIFSMDGDFGKLKEIVSLKKRFGFSLIVDEAHSLGVLGESGRGWSAIEDLADEIDITIGTCGKALGMSGGFICGSRSLVDWMQQKCRGWIYSTAPPPYIASGLLESIKIVSGEMGDELRRRLHHNITVAKHEILGKAPENDKYSPIIPYVVGDNSKVLRIQNKLKEYGFHVGAIRYPSVSKNSARLRITINSNHCEMAIKKLAEILKSQ